VTKKCITDSLSREARKVFEGILQYQINLSQRYYPYDAFTIVIVQVEDLKEHNEKVIEIMKKKVGQFLLKNSRGSDTVAPLSIDKFIILSPCTTLEGGEAFVKKLKVLANDERYDLSFAVGEYDREGEEQKEDFLLRVNNLLLHSDSGDTSGLIL
jgi:GGDEF domain-containing protein